MPLTNLQGAGAQTKMPLQSGMEAIKVLLPPERAVSLRYNTNNQRWEYNLHDLNGWRACPDQNEYKPPMQVTGIILRDSSNLAMDVSINLSGTGDTAKQVNKEVGQIMIHLTLLTNIVHQFHVTKVWLDQTLTTAQYIVFLQ